MLASCGGIAGVPDAGGDAATDAALDAPSADGGADVADDAFVPPSDGGIGSVPGLVLWLRADTAVTHDGQGLVSAWADQSGKGNDAAQTDPARQPSYAPSGVHGLPSVHFTQGATEGSVLFIQDSASMRWGTGDFLVEIVAAFDNDPAGFISTGLASLFFKPGSSAGIFFFGNRMPGGNPPVGPGLMARIDTNVPGKGNQVDVGAAYNDGAPRLYAFRRAGTTLDLRVNGASVASMTQVGTIDVSATGIKVYVGADDFDQNVRLDGDIAEIVATAGPTSAGDLGMIESTLLTKYGL